MKDPSVVHCYANELYYTAWITHCTVDSTNKQLEKWIEN